MSDIFKSADYARAKERKEFAKEARRIRESEGYRKALDICNVGLHVAPKGHIFDKPRRDYVIVPYIPLMDDSKEAQEFLKSLTDSITEQSRKNLQEILEKLGNETILRSPHNNGG